MTVFDGMLTSAGAMFGNSTTSDSIRPGARPDAPADFRREPDARQWLSGCSTDDVYNQWVVRAKYIASQARAVATQVGDTPAALARLAHASLTAGDVDAAVSAALETFDKLSVLAQTTSDIPAAISAAWVLILSDKADLADARLADVSPSPSVTLMRAGLAVDAEESRRALSLLESSDFPEAHSLRGYVHLKLDDPQRAIRDLRNAWQEGNPSPDVAANLATAFWRIGSRRKALKYARTASRLAPGRKDISLMLIDYLIFSNEIEAARSEIRSILAEGIAEAPELMIRQAQIALAMRDTRRALGLLRGAESMARASDELQLASQISGRIALVERYSTQLPRRLALGKVRSLLSQYPEDLNLALIYSALCDRSSMAFGILKVLDEFAHYQPSSDLLPVRAQLARLEGRFEDAADIAAEWSKAQPFDPIAADLSILLRAYVTLDWKSAGRAATSALRRFPRSPYLINNAAYILVLAGRPESAARVMQLMDADDYNTNFVVLATRGLIEISRGDIQPGLKLYRRAAEVAENTADGSVDRALVTLYQGMALRLIGAFDEVSGIAIRAGALPPVSLPNDYGDIPEFKLLQWVCERASCVWPPVLM